MTVLPSVIVGNLISVVFALVAVVLFYEVSSRLVYLEIDDVVNYDELEREFSFKECQ